MGGVTPIPYPLLTPTYLGVIYLAPIHLPDSWVDVAVLVFQFAWRLAVVLALGWLLGA